MVTLGGRGQRRVEVERASVLTPRPVLETDCAHEQAPIDHRRLLPFGLLLQQLRPGKQAALASSVCCRRSVPDLACRSPYRRVVAGRDAS